MPHCCEHRHRCQLVNLTFIQLHFLPTVRTSSGPKTVGECPQTIFLRGGANWWAGYARLAQTHYLLTLSHHHQLSGLFAHNEDPSVHVCTQQSHQAPSLTHRAAEPHEYG